MTDVASPRVSVVMTAYNDLRFLDAAVDSIIRQTYRNFEFIIVDDGTGMHDIFARLAARDPRIRIITNQTNLTSPMAINRGIRASRGDIVARLDADDVAKPERLALLVAAFDADPGLGLLGSSFIYIDEAGVPHRIRQMPETDVDVRWTIHFLNPFCHSSVAFRRSCFDTAGGYNESRRLSTDHEFWFRLLTLCRAGNLRQPLVEFRVNMQGSSMTNSTNWRARSDALREPEWARLGVKYDPTIAYELSRFIREKKFDNVGLRGPAYHTCLNLLRRFAAAPRPFARPGDADDVRRLARTTFERMLADKGVDLARAVDADDLAWAQSLLVATMIECDGLGTRVLAGQQE